MVVVVVVVQTYFALAVGVSVAASLIRHGHLKVGEHELSVTEFTGNVHEFPPSNEEQMRELSEHVHEVNVQLDEKQRLAGMLVSACYFSIDNMIAELQYCVIDLCFPALFRVHTHTQPFYGSLEIVWDNPGEPVPEETFTHYTHRSHQSSLFRVCEKNEHKQSEFSVPKC